MPNTHVAVDIGGSGVKITAARLQNGRVENLREQTLPNRPLLLGGHQYIDIYRLYGVIFDALQELCAAGQAPASFGIDTYGNGYGVLNADGELVGLPFFYKDARTSGVLDALARRIPLRELYEETAVYPTDIRVLAQLFLDARDNSARLRQAEKVLLFPDLLSYFFTGRALSERSMASVAQLLDRRGEWCGDVMARLGVSPALFAPLVDGGANGARPLLPDVRAALGGDIAFVDVVTHDTESALLAAPLLDGDAVFASLGTSVIFGARTPLPVVSDASYAGRFKNMRGAFGQNSLCRDYNGLWLLEQCMAHWRLQTPGLTYDDVVADCRAAPPSDSYFDVTDPGIRFYKGTLPDAIRGYCRATGQSPPQSRGEVALCALESIVLEAKWSYEHIRALTGADGYKRISVVGGGVRNGLLLQMLADALGLPLYAGSPYAATTGNILMQLYALGELPSPEAVAQAAQSTCGANRLEPSGNSTKWDEALIRLEQYKAAR